MHKLPAGVLGASGYAGRELCALIARHPGLELAFATANERRGEQLRVAGSAVTLLAGDDAPLGEAAVVFCALPHGASAAWAQRARAAGARVVDLSSDLRPGARMAGGTDDVIPYGLTELARDRIRGARLVANPGCYATAVLLAIAPLVAMQRIARGGTVTVAAASGVTGAGAGPRADLMFGELTEDFRVYAAGNEHRHLPEMRAVIRELGGDLDLIFTPHLLPVARGILATITVPLVAPLADPLALWREYYGGEPFIELVSEPPTLRDVARRNVVRIAATPAAGVRVPTLIVTAALDNLVKGAAGQALQNANLMLGLPETQGLPA